ncbi:MAG TPA: hypothetical protein PKE69_21370 [Pyrinomonadaceae bacterium]|nr:hypothetical protein [Pyrinomonadaceae bacterium]
MSQFEDYSLVWQKCSSDGKLAEKYFVPGFEGSLPFLLSGNDILQFEEGKVEVNEETLLKGIFIGLFELENDPKPWHRDKDKETYLYLLDVLGNGFGFKDPEQLILDVAASVRVKNGNTLSRIVLKTGLNLIPFSSKIRSDLVCDTWAVISENESHSYLFDEIIELASETYLESLLPDAKEVVCYYKLCAMVLSEESIVDIEMYLKEFIYPNVKLQTLKVKIKELLENSNSISAKDLRVM